tara:strand:+ start:14947 stop:16173 length:1227 start_codon:yes stop_codon:yes gene_type:complete
VPTRDKFIHHLLLLPNALSKLTYFQISYGDCMSKSLNIYINGTDEPNGLDGFVTSLANVLHEMTEQTDTQKSICIDGCAINNSDPRDLGAIFTFNLEKQVDSLVNTIKKQISDGEKLKLNLYGFSRGGAAVFWICEKLKTIDPSLLEINVCSFEPVPGNFIRGSYIDNISGFKSTLSGIISDLSDCKNINKVMALFTNQPLPDIACHGPILPVMPPQAQVRVDVLPGCHKGAELFHSGHTLTAYNNESAISFHVVTRFLESCGTTFNKGRFNLEGKLAQESSLLGLLNHAKAGVQGTSRSMHFYNEIQTSTEKTYLNLAHKNLLTGQENDDSSDCILSVKNTTPSLDYWNGHTSNGYFPMFAKSAGIAAAAYYSPVVGVAAAATVACLYAKDLIQASGEVVEQKKHRM